MKISQNHASHLKRNSLIGLALVIVLGAGGTYAYYQAHHNSTTTTSTDTSKVNQVDYKKPTPPQVEAGNEQKKQTVTKGLDSSSSDTSGNTASDQTVGVTITHAIQNNTGQPDSTISIGTLIDGITSSGSCALTLTKGSATVTKTSGVQPLANNTTCKGFTVPVSELSAGTWRISLQASVNGKTGSASQDVIVN